MYCKPTVQPDDDATSATRPAFPSSTAALYLKTKMLPEDACAPDGPEEIDLTSFRDEFVLPDRGTTFVVVETDSDEAWSSFQTLLDEIRTDKHAD